jgi:hypothetical protein
LVPQSLQEIESTRSGLGLEALSGAPIAVNKNPEGESCPFGPILARSAQETYTSRLVYQATATRYRRRPTAYCSAAYWI